MKVVTESAKSKDVWVKPMEFTLQKGLIGLPDIKRVELLINEEEEPFMWIRDCKDAGLAFVVIQPSEFIDSYEIEIADDDMKALGISNSEDALILNIVNLKEEQAGTVATANLIGPIILNKNTLEGRQVIIANNSAYSSKHDVLGSLESN